MKSLASTFASIQISQSRTFASENQTHAQTPALISKPNGKYHQHLVVSGKEEKSRARTRILFLRKTKKKRSGTWKFHRTLLRGNETPYSLNSLTEKSIEKFYIIFINDYADLKSSSSHNMRIKLQIGNSKLSFHFVSALGRPLKIEKKINSNVANLIYSKLIFSRRFY